MTEYEINELSKKQLKIIDDKLGGDLTFCIKKRINNLQKENEELKKKLCLMRKYIYGNYDLEYKEMQLQHIDEFGTELKVVRK